MIKKFKTLMFLSALSMYAQSPLIASWALDHEDNQTQLALPGRVLPPFSGNRQQLVVLLHGVMGEPDHMLEIAKSWL